MNGELGRSRATIGSRAARELGSDVPFFLTGTGGTRRRHGRTRHGARRAARLVGRRRTAARIGPDRRGLSSSRRIARRRRAHVPAAQRVARRCAPSTRCSATTSPRLQRELVNDFHEPILRAFPEIARADAALRAAARQARSCRVRVRVCLRSLKTSVARAVPPDASIAPRTTRSSSCRSPKAMHGGSGRPRRRRRPTNSSTAARIFRTRRSCRSPEVRSSPARSRRCARRRAFGALSSSLRRAQTGRPALADADEVRADGAQHHAKPAHPESRDSIPTRSS